MEDTSAMGYLNGGLIKDNGIDSQKPLPSSPSPPTLNSQSSIVPESPPMSQPVDSQDQLMKKLMSYVDAPLKIAEDPDEFQIEDYDDNEPRSSNKDVIIDMDIEENVSNPFPVAVNKEQDDGFDDDDDIFLQNAEELEKQVLNQSLNESVPKIDISAAAPQQRSSSDEENREIVSKMKRLDPSERIFPDVKANSFHTVAFFMSPDYKPGDYLQPHPATFQSKWDEDFVPFPCANQNTRLLKIRIPPESDNEERPRFKEERIWMWTRIQAALTSSIMCFQDIVAALKNYMNVKGELNALSYCLGNIMMAKERENFFSKVLPFMQTLCLDTEMTVTCALPLLNKFKNQSISLSQRQIACLLANAFFCTFPKRFSDELQFPTINFIELFQCQEEDNGNYRLANKAQKIRCILNYFARISEEMPRGVVTFTRKSIRNSSAPVWEESTKKLGKIVALQNGTIEDDGVGMLQVDFANKFVGGGVLGSGAVQEEILFVIYPELIVSRLFTEKLTSCEAIIVTGCERFSSYSGYARSFRYEGDFYDVTPIDPRGRRCEQFVAIDALYITRPVTQFHPRFLTRELNKAYVGFFSPSGNSIPVATGKWGCGAFNGNPQLKAVLQLLAASQAGRDVVFFTFGDSIIQNQIEEMYNIIKDMTIQQVWKLLSQYYSLFCTTLKPKYTLCEYIVRFGNCDFPDTDLTSNAAPKFKEVPITKFYSREESPAQSSSSSSFPTISSKVPQLPNTVAPFGKDGSLSATEISEILKEDEELEVTRQVTANQATSSNNSKQLSLADLYS